MLGKEVAERTSEACEQLQQAHAPIEVYQGDIADYDWFDADLIYLSAVCFSEELVTKVCDLLARCKPGTRIMSLRELEPRDHIQNYAAFDVRMDWGPGRIFYSKTV